MTRFRPNQALIAIILLAAFTLVSYGQTAGITGTVTDATGASVIDVDVRIISVDTGFIRETKTNEQGNYSLPLLQPGALRWNGISNFDPFAKDPATGYSFPTPAAS